MAICWCRGNNTNVLHVKLHKTDFRLSQRFSENGSLLIDVGCNTDVSDILIIPILKTYVWRQCVRLSSLYSLHLRRATLSLVFQMNMHNV